MKKQNEFLITERDKSLRALQLIQLEGLKELDRICRKNDIKYSLGGGTCLGQIRHGGFIPWDDDIDIDMTTENYEKFLEVAPKELDSNKFFLRSNKTDTNFKRSFSRLEMKNTRIGPKSWDKINLKSGIFVDIFEWNYLPDNKFLRKIVTNLLFYIRWLEMYKMLNSYTLDNKYRTFWNILKRIVPYKFLFWAENKLKKCCGKRKTNWIIDNAVINGNHGGYLSDGIDEYVDVEFEGIKVMNKKNANNFMKTIYGEHYNEWLPPVKRISHHKWYRLSFGVYEPLYDIPENYKDYLTVKYTTEKLKHMQSLSFEMADVVTKICENNNLKCFIMGAPLYIKNKNIDDYGDFWTEPIMLAMPRLDFDEFSKIAQNELGNKYFFQTSETDKEYKYSYARIRLNYTSIREAKVPKYLEESYNSGFFIKIIPLDNTSDNFKLQKIHKKKIRYLNHFISLKWTKNNLRAFIRCNFKRKIKLIMLLPFSVNFLKRKLEKETKKYNNIETNYYIDSTGYQLKGIIIKKDILSSGIYENYNGYSFLFPVMLSTFCEQFKNKKLSKELDKLDFIKNEFPKSYEKYKKKFQDKKIKNIQKKYPTCYLTYFDLPEFQLSVLRYDEKTDRMLSNDEIINYEKN